MADVLVLGTGGTSIDIVETLALPPYCHVRVLGFLDDNRELQHRYMGGVPVLGPLELVHRYPEAKLILALGSPRSFARRLEILSGLGLAAREFLTVVHPTAWISPSAKLGPGCAVLAFTQVGSGACLSGHNVILSHCSINHDTRIGLGSLCASGVTLCGDTEIGECCYLGAGVVVRDGISIGSGTLVGAGAVVVKNLGANGIYVGNPARPIGAESGSSAK